MSDGNYLRINSKSVSLLLTIIITCMRTFELFSIGIYNISCINIRMFQVLHFYME